MDNFPIYISNFFTKYLANERNFSLNTIKSYRDTFTLILEFFKIRLHIEANKISLINFTKINILEFLDWLESDRNYTIRSRNQRLAAIHCFCKYIQYKHPELLAEFQSILEIKFKKFENRTVDYLTEDQISGLLHLPDTNNLIGRRHLTILSVLYDTAARVQEICDLKLDDIRLNNPCTITLTGKGNKVRIVPLLDNTRNLLSAYIDENNNIINSFSSGYLFFNKNKEKLTRFGVTYILNKYVSELRNQISDLPKSISPHTLRHSKAMHMYHSGINLIYIRDILGHSDISITDIYAKSDIESKKRELEKCYTEDLSTNLPDWSDDKQLLNFLKNL